MCLSQFWRLESQGASMVLLCRGPSSPWCVACASLPSRHTVRVASCISGISVIISTMRALPSHSHHPQQAPPPNAIASGVRISACRFEGYSTIQSIEDMDFCSVEYLLSGIRSKRGCRACCHGALLLRISVCACRNLRGLNR